MNILGNNLIYMWNSIIFPVDHVTLLRKIKTPIESLWNIRTPK